MEPKSPSLLDALTPVLVLIIGLAASVTLYGDNASYGPNQIVLFLVAGIAMIVGWKNGYKWEQLEYGLQKGISISIGAILILLAVGSLIGTFLLAGTVPTLIYYGLHLLNPAIFYAATCVICAVVALSIGSSWTVAATVGVALMGVSQGLGMDKAITAGAVISGAYFGDKMSPLSETTNLAPAVAGSELFSHIRNMARTSIPAFVLALLVFVAMGWGQGSDFDPSRLEAMATGLKVQFQLGWYLLLPLVLVLVLAMMKMPAFPAIAIGALTGGLWAALFQPDAIRSMSDGSGSYGLMALTVVWQALFEGITVQTGTDDLDALLSGGGMGSMLNTVWLILAAMSFGAVMETCGLLRRLVQAILSGVKTSGSLIATTITSCFGVNLLTADQYIAIVVPGRMFKAEYEERGLSPLNLSRALEDGGTITSPLVPWNSCGAYMQGVLMVNPIDYALYAFFNWFSPVIGILLAHLGVGIKMALPRTSRLDSSKESAQ
ncbi:Na+/H+ antiporter NhaC [Ferrimonas balearica]|uniref:Na+/H+ antiporter NhaC n=1 Tax=Ferrimonas balearica TaxID=44012 RepID=UPI001C993C56|nr:Na+/H+ antiporter NhaC [Ferrimonas balearica]MBY5920451.1 Na+/H+ antiporter NhaC [Ferrimonas balearica]MBY5996864.1 Na+/H+ antiporter NhaC [Ferrimonas balearica]